MKKVIASAFYLNYKKMPMVRLVEEVKSDHSTVWSVEIGTNRDYYIIICEDEQDANHRYSMILAVYR